MAGGWQTAPVTLFADVAATSRAVAAASARNAKRDALAEQLARLRPDEVAPTVGYLVGEPRQGRFGVGWATVAGVDVPPAAEPSLEILDVDAAFTDLMGMSGSGSVAARRDRLAALYGRATPPEGELIGQLLTGGLRQGALEGVMLDAVARAAGVPATVVRRAAMLAGDLGRAATVALTDGRPGLEAIGLSVLTPVQPMLASTASDVGTAIADLDGPVAVEWKLDGARIQVHRRGDDVRVFTRNLNEITEGVPHVVAVTRSLPVDDLVLDGEVLHVLDDDRPARFQDTMKGFGREAAMRPFFFDVLAAGGRDLLDEPLTERSSVLDEVAGEHRIPRLVTADPGEADAFLAGALAAGHEGVMVKGLDSTYAAGRRGKAWRKVKPVRLLDLVVLAAEWGHGRRRGWLSNLHLGARDPDTGSFVMVGKTFKGLTDELLTWQTAALLEREIGREGITVHVRPELVVEIALDGVQVSTRYPGGVALRFARVKRYRDDKPASEADTIGTVQSLLG
jgi:DNA ligase-1